MNNNLILRWITVGLLVWGLSACSTIKSWFPDKERDYQFTSEIPELIVPDDLKNKGLAALSVQPAQSVQTTEESESVSGSRYSAEADVDTEANTATEAEAKQSPDENGGVSSEQPVSVATGGSSLHIDQPQNQAVRMVGRALTRQKLEVVERNIGKGYFYVKFDPNAVKASDEDIWDELNFLFGDDPSQEQEYRITVKQIEPQISQVTIQDSAGDSLSNDTANALLKLITDAINEVETQDAGKEVPIPEAQSGQTPPEKPISQE